jgi:hypothetical protein
MIEACAQDVYPDPKIHLGFTMCLSLSYEAIPDKDLVEYCASEHGIDIGKINDCMSSDDGKAMALLRDSAQHSIDAGVVYSCTVRLQDKIRCIMDDGQWKDCPGGSDVKDLVNEIKELSQSKA